MKSNEKPIDEEKVKAVPHDLDLTPYRDLKDSPVLDRLVKAAHGSKDVDRSQPSTKNRAR
ncbi:hypothetical protein C7I87_24815 [Mesorhizobium sp. SARCC-RB16n]|uniref:hypothetical protein n=1 Tax=Mesorhizobium sp. SARCC-RB16n TaxID=2116687 RepID=UPI00122FA327|nr:hypothetical protein [Mesorhizobium sp. SARCC-RB16n]KAA3447814.1 hypothetical protein C7I87_24815 [Mesorhizobium sp. SARCC-RB16n]